MLISCPHPLYKLMVYEIWLLKKRLNGLQGVESSYLSVPTSKIKGLAPLSKAGLTAFCLRVKR